MSPRSFRQLVLGSVCAVVLGLSFAVPLPATSRQPLPAEDIVPVEDSMHEFMEYVFQPTYLRLKQSMAAAPADNKDGKRSSQTH